jgi:ATP-dependent helicase/nuclease subunit A
LSNQPGRKSSPRPPDQKERDKIRNCLDRNILVEAAAGTGKTTSMVGRMVELLARGECRIDRIAAVTFTRKAAAELRTRFQEGVEAAAEAGSDRSPEERERLAGALARVELAFIGTIHSFCGRLLRERPVEAEVDLDFREIDAEEDAEIRREAWDLFVARLFAGGDTLDALRGDLEDAILSPVDLGDGFLTFANYPDVNEWPAPAVGRLPLDPTVKKLEDYARHMRTLSPLFGDYGSDKLMPLYKMIPRMVSQNDMKDPGDVLEILERCRKCAVTLKYWPDKKMAKDEKERWKTFVEEVAAPFCENFLESRYQPALRAYQAARTVYDELRRKRGALNFQDLLMRAAALLRNSPHVREYFARRFTHLLVDEFQDTDPIQAEVILLLTADDASEENWRQCRPRQGSLFVVGDPKQSIYRFRRADIQTYNEVKRLITENGGEIASLTANFRTVRPLQEWVNTVFGTGETFPAAADRYSPDYVALEQGRTDGTPGPELEGVGVIRVPDELSNKELIREWEPRLIARIIRSHVDRGTPVPRTESEAARGVDPAAGYGDFLIVTGKKAALSLYGRALQELGIPHQVTGGHAMNEVSEIELLRKTLAAVIRPDDPVALVALLRCDLFGFSDAELYAFRRAGGHFSFPAPVPEGLSENDGRDRFRDAFNRLKGCAGWLLRFPPVPAIEKIAIDLGLFVRAAAGEEGNSLAGGLAKAIEVLRAGQADSWSAAEAVAELTRIASLEKEYDGLPARSSNEPAVRIMNLHKVKGLEAPVTFLADPFGRGNDRDATIHVDRSKKKTLGYIPVTKKGSGFHSTILAIPPAWKSSREEEKKFLRAEETRLLYVAATRAGTRLVVVQRGKSNHTNPWKFFDPWLKDVPAIDDPGTPGDQGTAIPAETTARSGTTVSAERIAVAAREIPLRWGKVRAPTYAIVTAKESGKPESAARREAAEADSGEFPLPPADRAGGWGTVIHNLLEARLRDESCDLSPLAGSSCDDEGIDRCYVKTALHIIDRVTRSDIWKRARGGKPCLAETPIELLLSDDDARAEGVPTLIRGTVDLLFREEKGWVIVDWKTDRVFGTDRVSGKDLSRMAARYRHQLDNYTDAWERSTGEKIIERGIYSVSADLYVRVDREE